MAPATTPRMNFMYASSGLLSTTRVDHGTHKGSERATAVGTSPRRRAAPPQRSSTSDGSPTEALGPVCETRRAPAHGQRRRRTRPVVPRGRTPIRAELMSAPSSRHRRCLRTSKLSRLWMGSIWRAASSVPGTHRASMRLNDVPLTDPHVDDCTCASSAVRSDRMRSGFGAAHRSFAHRALGSR
jgi:hypothetical protein